MLKGELNKKHFYIIIGIVFALVIIQMNEQFIHDAFAQADPPPVYHDPTEIWPQGAGSGLDTDFLDGLDSNEILAQASGSPMWRIEITSVSYTGDLGGRKGANEKCEAEFDSGAIMFGTQHINCYSQGTCALDYRVTNWGWFDYTGNTPNSDNPTLLNWIYPFPTCNGWSSTNPGSWDFFHNIQNLSIHALLR